MRQKAFGTSSSLSMQKKNTSEIHTHLIFLSQIFFYFLRICDFIFYLRNLSPWCLVVTIHTFVLMTIFNHQLEILLIKSTKIRILLKDFIFIIIHKIFLIFFFYAQGSRRVKNTSYSNEIYPRNGITARYEFFFFLLW